MRSAQDSINTAGMHAGADIYLGYVPPGHTNYPGLPDAFPGKIYGSIATHFTADADILDWEAATTGTGPEQVKGAVLWVQRQRRAGRVPTIYVQLSLWSTLQRAFTAANEPVPLWWIAHWTNTAHLEPGSVATQWGGAPGVDYSSVAAYWPGIDPVPPTRKDNQDMFVLVNSTIGEWVIGAGYAYHLHLPATVVNTPLPVWNVADPTEAQGIINAALAGYPPTGSPTSPATQYSFQGTLTEGTS